jgi:hypothetical protein
MQILVPHSLGAVDEDVAVALLRCRFLTGSSGYAPGVDYASPPDTTADVVRHAVDGLIGWAAPQAGPERG